MDFFNVLQTKEDTPTSKTLKGRDMDLSFPETQTQTNVDDEEDSYTNYQRDLILGFTDDNKEDETTQPAADTSYMAGIRKRLLEKKRVEEEKKSFSTTTQPTQVLTNSSSTQVILSNVETQPIDSTQEVATQIIETASIKETQILQSDATQIVENPTQRIADDISDESDDEPLTVKRKTVLDSDLDSDNEILPTQKVKRAIALQSDDEEDIVSTNKKKVSFIGSEDDRYDDDDDDDEEEYRQNQHRFVDSDNDEDEDGYFTDDHNPDTYSGSSDSDNEEQLHHFHEHSHADENGSDCDNDAPSFAHNENSSNDNNLEENNDEDDVDDYEDDDDDGLSLVRSQSYNTEMNWDPEEAEKIVETLHHISQAKSNSSS